MSWLRAAEQDRPALLIEAPYEAPWYGMVSNQIKPYDMEWYGMVWLNHTVWYGMVVYGMGPIWATTDTINPSPSAPPQLRSALKIKIWNLRYQIQNVKYSIWYTKYEIQSPSYILDPTDDKIIVWSSSSSRGLEAKWVELPLGTFSDLPVPSPSPQLDPLFVTQGWWSSWP